MKRAKTSCEKPASCATRMLLLAGMLGVSCGGPLDLGTPRVNPDLLPGEPGRALLADASGKLVEVDLAAATVRTLRPAGQGEVNLVWLLLDRDWEKSWLGLEMPTSHGWDLVASRFDPQSESLSQGPSMTVSDQVIAEPSWLPNSERLLSSRSLYENSKYALDVFLWDLDSGDNWSIARWYPHENWTEFCPAVPDPQGRFAYQSLIYQESEASQPYSWLVRYDLKSGSVSYLLNNKPPVCAFVMRSDNSALGYQYDEDQTNLVEVQLDGPRVIRLTNSTAELHGWLRQWGQVAYLARVNDGHIEIKAIDLNTMQIELRATTSEIDSLMGFELLP